VRYPYDRLLRFFVSRKVDVNQALERYGLPPVGDLWIAKEQARISKEAPYALAAYMGSKGDELMGREGILDWADGEGFGELWKLQKEFGGGPPPPEIDLSFRVFMNPHSRGTMGLLLLSGIPKDEIEEILQEKYDIEFNEKALEVYERIFWDVSHMGRRGWDDFIPSLRSKHERHSIALGLEGLTPEEIRDLVEVGVTLDPEQITSQIAATAIIQFNKAKKQPIPVGADIRMWADMALKAAKQLHDIRPKVSESDNEIPSGGFAGLFSVQISKSSHPTLAELQGEVATPRKPRREEGDG